MLHQDCVPAGLSRAAAHPQRSPALAPDFEPQYHRLTDDASIPSPAVSRFPSLPIVHDAPGALGADLVSERYHLAITSFPSRRLRTGREASCPFDESLADVGRAASAGVVRNPRRTSRRALDKLCQPNLLV
ncbi:hypothetical protein [Accumulibacter sp.]|uniref:hypothetical protein n=1 Tax=Accumulibacter sp. TaxID=2053492 RepID=UPI002631C7D1|nr:hypothetical protein [Accumulibacter sp.]